MIEDNIPPRIMASPLVLLKVVTMISKGEYVLSYVSRIISNSWKFLKFMSEILDSFAKSLGFRRQKGKGLDHVARVRLFDCGRLGMILLPLPLLHFSVFFFFFPLLLVFFVSLYFGLGLRVCMMIEILVLGFLYVGFLGLSLILENSPWFGFGVFYSNLCNWLLKCWWFKEIFIGREKKYCRVFEKIMVYILNIPFP